VKVQIEDITPIKKRMKFELPKEGYQEALDQAYRKLGKTVQIKGFRKGKVPRAVLEKYYGARTSMETVSELIDRSYQEAIREHQVPAVGMPKISDLKMDENAPITFSAEVEVQPRVEAKHYEKIKLKKSKIEISDEELQAELLALQRAHAQWIPLEEGALAEAGHAVTVNYEGTMDGTPFEGGSGQNIQILLGAGRFLPDFEKGLMGVKGGERREFDVNFPADYGVAALQGKKVQFKVEVLSIKREELPRLDDEFAKDLGSYESIDQVKSQLKERMLQSKEAHERGHLFQQVSDHLIAKNSFEIPGVMVDREVDFMWRNVLQQLSQQKMTPEHVGINEADYKAKNREEATKRIKGFLLFDSIAGQNKLEVTEEEINKKLEEIAQGYKQPVEAVKRFYEERGLLRQLYSQLLEEKTLDFILSKAKISEKK
jgi:trigger factor